MKEDLQNLIPSEAVRAWIYRVCLLVTVITIVVALIFGVEPAAIVTTITGIVAVLTSALATVNTSRTPGN